MRPTVKEVKRLFDEEINILEDPMERINKVIEHIEEEPLLTIYPMIFMLQELKKLWKRVG